MMKKRMLTNFRFWFFPFKHCTLTTHSRPVFANTISLTPAGGKMSRLRSHGFNLIHRNDLLNALLAIQAASQAIDLDQTDDGDRQNYQAGFDAALLAVAQMIGQSEAFLAQKAKLRENDLKATETSFLS
jgi:hypothetical protein